VSSSFYLFDQKDQFCINAFTGSSFAKSIQLDSDFDTFRFFAKCLTSSGILWVFIVFGKGRDDLILFSSRFYFLFPSLLMSNKLLISQPIIKAAFHFCSAVISLFCFSVSFSSSSVGSFSFVMKGALTFG